MQNTLKYILSLVQYLFMHAGQLDDICYNYNTLHVTVMPCLNSKKSNGVKVSKTVIWAIVIYRVGEICAVHTAHACTIKENNIHNASNI